MQVRAVTARQIAAGTGVVLWATAWTETAFAAGAFPPFDPYFFPSQLFWLAITFGTLYWLMSRIALPRVGAILADRSAAIARDLDEAAAIKAKVELVVKDYEQSLAESRRNAQAIAQEARSVSARESDARRHATESALAAKLAEAETTITARKTAAMANVESIAAEAAAEIVGKLLGTQPSPAEAAAAVKSTLNG